MSGIGRGWVDGCFERNWRTGDFRTLPMPEEKTCVSYWQATLAGSLDKTGSVKRLLVLCLPYCPFEWSDLIAN